MHEQQKKLETKKLSTLEKNNKKHTKLNSKTKKRKATR